MYDYYPNEEYVDTLRIDATFTERQALQRIIDDRGLRLTNFSVGEDQFCIYAKESLSGALLVLTAWLVVDKETFKEEGCYVLSSAVKSFTEKLKAIWEDLYE